MPKKMKSYGYVTLRLKRYFTDEGEPTCIRSANNGMICEFFRVCRMGTGETCLFNPEFSESLKRRSYKGTPEHGYLIPGKHCRVFTAKEIAKCTNS